VAWQLDAQVLEIRYPSAHVFLDIAGSLADSLKTRIAGIEVEKIDAEFISCEHKDSGSVLRLGSRQSLFKMEAGLSQTKALELAREFFEIALDALKPGTLSRIGHRTTYLLPVENLARARAYANKWGANNHMLLFAASEDERLRKKELVEMELKFQDELLGLTLTLKPIGIALNAKPHVLATFGLKLPPEQQFIAVDLDHYTKVATPIEAFLPAELMKSNWKLAETRILPMFPERYDEHH